MMESQRMRWYSRDTDWRIMQTRVAHGSGWRLVGQLEQALQTVLDMREAMKEWRCCGHSIRSCSGHWDRAGGELGPQMCSSVLQLGWEDLHELNSTQRSEAVVPAVDFVTLWLICQLGLQYWNVSGPADAACMQVCSQLTESCAHVAELNFSDLVSAVCLGPQGGCGFAPHDRYNACCSKTNDAPSILPDVACWMSGVVLPCRFFVQLCTEEQIDGHCCRDAHWNSWCWCL